MKKIVFSLTLACALILSSQAVLAQMMMQVDPALNAAAGPSQVKQKGVKAVPLYYFDEYRIVTSKAGWLTTNSRSNRQGVISSSSQQLAFSMVNAAGDTAVVNMSKNGLIQSESNFWFPGITMSQGSQNVATMIESTVDTLVWGVAVSLANGVFDGAIKLGEEELKIVPEKRLETGKMVPFALWAGFGIYRGDKEIAAVQATPKRYIWMLPNLPEDQKLKLAAACLSLIVMEQQQWLTE